MSRRTAIATRVEIREAHEIVRLRDEIEQLRTSLESSDEDNSRLVEHRDQLLARIAAQARELQAVTTGYERALADMRAAEAVPLIGARESAQEEELKVAFEELTVITEELEVANASLRVANQALDARVEERNRFLTESEARFRGLVEGFAQAVWETSDTGEVIGDSLSWRAFTGRSLEAWREEGWLEAIHPDDRPEAEGLWRDALASGEPLNAEFRVQDALNRWCWTNVRAVPIRGEDGAIRKWAGLNIDVSARREAEDRLRASEERLGLALSVSGLATWDWHIPADEVAWSNEHFWALGYRAGEVTPSLEAWAARVHPEDRNEALASLGHARDAHEEYSHEFRVRWPTGMVRTCFARGKFFYDDAGEAVRMIGVMEDVTDDREASHRLEVLVAELQHRTRNLITLVRALADRTLAGSTSLEDFRARYTSRIDALSRVQGLLSRLNEGDRITFDELIVTELSALGFAEGSPQIALDGPRSVRLRSSTVQTFALALHELATNAVKYGALSRPDGRLTITWRLDGANGDQRMHLDWLERGVPPAPEGPDQPRRRGYGRELIERALPYQLGAVTEYELGPDGVRCSVSLPVSQNGSRTDD